MKRRSFLAVAALVGLVVLSPAVALAATTSFKQKVLPLNCVFQEVNDGLGTLYYLTPNECGVVNLPPASHGNPGGNGSSGQAYYRVPFVIPYDPSKPVVIPANPHAGLPWQPIVAVVQSDGTVLLVSHNNHSGVDRNLFAALKDAVGKVPGAILHPTSTEIVVGTSAGLLLAVLLILALL